MDRVALRHTDSGARIVRHAPTLTVSKLIAALSDVPGDTPVIVTVSGDLAVTPGNVIDVRMESEYADTPSVVVIDALDNYDPRQW